MKWKMWTLIVLGCCGCEQSEPPPPESGLSASASIWPGLSDGEISEEQGENPWESATWTPPGEADDPGVGGHPAGTSGEDQGAGGEPGDDGGTTTSGGQPVVAVPEPLQRWLSLYEEGEGSIKRLGIAGEAGTSPVPCVVEVYANGGTSPWRKLSIAESIPESGSILFCSDAAWGANCTHEMSGSLYNGNDALVVRCGEFVFDSLGTIGEDPGTAWSAETPAGLVRTEGQRLLRCDEFIDPNPTDPTTLEGWVAQGTHDEASALARCPGLNEGEGGAGGTTLSN